MIATARWRSVRQRHRRMMDPATLLRSSSAAASAGSAEHDRDGTAVPTTTVVALSGGVDSSVVASLLLEQASTTSIQAIHMSNWNVHDDGSLNPSPRTVDGNGEEDDAAPSSSIPPTRACGAETDWRDAVAVARHLRLPRPVRRLRFEREYWHHVWEPFVERLAAGGGATPTPTPDSAGTVIAGTFNNRIAMGNPDMDCNRYVKFGALQDWCRQQYGPDGYRLATGHYARVHRLLRPRESNGGEAAPPDDVRHTLEQHPWLWEDSRIGATVAAQSSPQPPQPLLLLAGVDGSKDQSYFLAGCHATHLRNVVFPLGHLFKTQGAGSVRHLARSVYRLPTAERRDSTGICFVGSRRGGDGGARRAAFRRFLRDYLPEATDAAPVRFVDLATGVTLGTTPEPDLACLWTIGQGARIGGTAQKYFVAGHGHSGHNTVLVCPGTHHPALYSESLRVDDVNWVVGRPPSPFLANGTLRVQCRIRHLQPLFEATLLWDSSADQSRRDRTRLPGSFSVIFDEPIRGVTRGQFAAFYLGSICLGGGPISEVGPTLFEQGKAVLVNAKPQKLGRDMDDKMIASVVP